MKGSTYRRCHCRDAGTGKPLGKACPQLAHKRHGTYAIRQELPARDDGSRRSFNRSGFATAKAAQEALDHVRALLGLPDPDDTESQGLVADLLESTAKAREPLPDIEDTRRRLNTGQDLRSLLTVGGWLDEWIAAKPGRRTSIRRDQGNIRNYLKPKIGDIRLDRLRVSHLTEMFKAIADDSAKTAENNEERHKAIEDLKTIRGRAARRTAKEAIAAMPPFRRPPEAATIHRIRATLRAALNDAIAHQLITFNPAAHVRLVPAKRAKALEWTEERVELWQRTGQRPSPVMVWTPQQTGRFLDHAMTDRLYPLFHLIAFRGLRRGEACGQLWTDTDLTRGLLTVARELVVDGWEVYEDSPKTEASDDVIALDSGTVAVLKAHRVRQAAERLQWGPAWVDTGRVFTEEDGAQVHPVKVSDRFTALHEEAGLPPIRLHDLRHGAATLAHAAGADLKAIQAMLRHSSIAITADTYTSLLREADQKTAEAMAALVPRAGREQPGSTAAHASLTHMPAEVVELLGKLATTLEKAQVSG